MNDPRILSALGKAKDALVRLESAIAASGSVADTSVIGEVPAPGPGIFPPPVALPWWRSPGAPYSEGENAADNPTRAKELAAQNKRVDGGHGSVADGQDFDRALAIADTLGSDFTTAADAEATVEGGASCDKDSCIYQVVLGQVNNPGTGRPVLMFPNTRLADVIHAPGKPVGGNVA